MRDDECDGSARVAAATRRCCCAASLVHGRGCRPSSRSRSSCRAGIVRVGSISATCVSRKNSRPVSSSYCLSNVPPVTRMARGWAIVSECRGDQESGIRDQGFGIRDLGSFCPGFETPNLGRGYRVFRSPIPDDRSSSHCLTTATRNTRHHFGPSLQLFVSPSVSSLHGRKALTLKALRVPGVPAGTGLCDTTGRE